MAEMIIVSTRDLPPPLRDLAPGVLSQILKVPPDALLVVIKNIPKEAVLKHGTRGTGTD